MGFHKKSSRMNKDNQIQDKHSIKLSRPRHDALWV